MDFSEAQTPPCKYALSLALVSAFLTFLLSFSCSLHCLSPPCLSKWGFSHRKTHQSFFAVLLRIAWLTELHVDRDKQTHTNTHTRICLQNSRLLLLHSEEDAVMQFLTPAIGEVKECSSSCKTTLMSMLCTHSYCMSKSGICITFIMSSCLFLAIDCCAVILWFCAVEIAIGTTLSTSCLYTLLSQPSLGKMYFSFLLGSSTKA